MDKKTINIQSLKYRFRFSGLRLTLLFIVLTFFGNACIEPFFAEIEEETKIITIEGSLIKGNDVQTIIISTTTSLVNQKFIPVRGCDVKVIDELNNSFTFDENVDGTYSLAIDDTDLVYDRQYRLNIVTPTGGKYESEYEILNRSVAVDTVYYEVEERIETYTGDYMEGVQFYIDIRAEDSTSRYFRWNLSETYEYTTGGPISYFFFDTSLEPIPPRNIWAVFRCWITEDIQGLYLSNTINLTINEKRKIPLQYVSAKTDRLKIKYSLLVTQYTMNEGAYNYWEQNKIATQEPGGLYTQQPSRPLTNLYSVNDSDERVLGYFWASSRSEQRIFVPRINSLNVHDKICELHVFDILEDGEGPFPIYVRVDEETGAQMVGNPYCFDCTLRGGSTTKPDFWK